MIANNLANASTTGYKRDDMAIREFEPMLLRRINDHSADTDVTSFKGFRIDGNRPPRVGMLGLGSAVDEIATDHLQGAMQTTGNTYDLAISGQGYFVIDTPQGPRYTRDGSFYRSANGQLQNVRGQAVLSAQGRTITIPADAQRVNITGDGRIYANGAQIAQLGFVQFDAPEAVIKQGDNLYRPQEGARPQQASGTIEQGMLEMSNTSVVTEMVELINNYRVYEAGSKAVQTQDTLLDKAVNDVGRAT
jgi:fagellar hook-basal body proteins